MRRGYSLLGQRLLHRAEALAGRMQTLPLLVSWMFFALPLLASDWVGHALRRLHGSRMKRPDRYVPDPAAGQARTITYTAGCAERALGYEVPHVT